MRWWAAAAVCVAALACVSAQAASADGSFESSDSLLNLIWRDSVQTARDMVSAPVDLDPRGCQIALPTVLLDGAVRDRCPYIGDQAVTGMTLLVSTDDVHVLHDMIVWFAQHQNSDGSIPASPYRNASLDLVDYNAYWIECLYDYVLYTGDLALLRQVWPNLQVLVDGLYPAHVSGGLLVNWLGNADYAYIPRGGAVVAYYNAQYVRALGLAASLAGWYGDQASAARWRDRAAATAAAFSAAFWDPAVGAFRDTTATSLHPQDGNAFAVLAGIATPQQAQSALAYVDRTMSQSYGNSIADGNGWYGPNWGDGDYVRVYPFISYFEVLARFTAGLDTSAVELIRREWGFMATRGPGTMWETIASDEGTQVDSTPSSDHGWSSGAAPALTSYVLGVQPTSPGFATFVVTPHPGGLASARGTVPTPRGPISVSWTASGGKLALQVSAPKGEVWQNAPAAPAQPAGTTTDATAAAATGASQTSASAAAGTRSATALARQLSVQLAAAWRATGGW
jgi:hypothetical protein